MQDFRVLTTTCDGASPYRTFYKYRRPLDAEKSTLNCKTPNSYADDESLIFFICEPVHLLKTARNN